MKTLNDNPYDISAAKTCKREVESLIECAGELKCGLLSIITWDQEETIERDGYTIKVVPLRKWILEGHPASCGE